MVTAATFDAILEGESVPPAIIKQSILSMLLAMDHLAPLSPQYVNTDDLKKKLEELRAEMS